MKKKIRCASLIALILSALFIIPLFGSCAASEGGYASDNMAPEMDYSKGEDYNGGVSYAPDGSLTADNTVTANRKIIRTYTVYGETKTYDSALAEINTSIAAYNGYISESRVTGASYNQYGSYGRTAYLVIKIPAENLDAFISQIGGALNVTSSASTQQDVSEAYYSIEARMKTLETERESLLQMMASINTASDYDFWYTLQKKISETEQQIAEYQAILKSYDGQVAYSTVNLTINEVGEYTVTVNISGAQRPAYYLYSSVPKEERNVSVTLDYVGLNGEATDKGSDGRYDPSTLLFILAAIMFTAEWMVYCYDKYQLR